MARRIPGIAPGWSNYLTCILLQMLLPLSPLLFEAIALQAAPGRATLAITTAMYAMSIGPSSENKAMFGLCTIIGMVENRQLRYNRRRSIPMRWSISLNEPPSDWRSQTESWCSGH